MRTPDPRQIPARLRGSRGGRARWTPGQRHTARPTRATSSRAATIPELGSDAQPRSRAAAARGRTGPSLMPSERAAGARHRRRHAGRAPRHRRRRRDGAQLEALAVRFVLQPRQAAGRGALASRRGLSPARSDRRRLRPPQPLHRAAHPAEARRTAEQRRARPAVGLEFLDDEAVEAFKEAEPFPNPPRQLIENGTINFGFGFLFDLNGPPQMRWFRYNTDSEQSVVAWRLHLRAAAKRCTNCGL